MADALSIELRGVTKEYLAGGARARVLDRLDLTVAAGEMVALMGPSGSGKSTLLNLVAGLDRPTSGTVLAGGRPLEGLTDDQLSAWRSRNVGFIFQRYHLLSVLTAEQNVEVPLLLFKLPGEERRRRVRTALELVGLLDRARHYPRQLSGGQEQRVAIARAIVTDPGVLLADEPTGNLDGTSAGEILDLVGLLNRQLGKTVVMVTHDPAAAARAGRLLYLNKGVLAPGATAGGT